MRISFLFFLLMYCCGGLFHVSIRDMLHFGALHSVFPAPQLSQRSHDRDQSDRPGRQLTTLGCIDDDACSPKHVRQRERRDRSARTILGTLAHSIVCTTIRSDSLLSHHHRPPFIRWPPFI